MNDAEGFKAGVKSKGSLGHLVVGKSSSSEKVHPKMEAMEKDVTGRHGRLREKVGVIHYRGVFVPFTWI